MLSDEFAAGLRDLLRFAAALSGDDAAAAGLVAQGFARAVSDVGSLDDVERVRTLARVWTVRAYLSEGMVLGAPSAPDVDTPRDLPHVTGDSLDDRFARASKLARTVLLLHYGAGLPAADVARTVGSTPDGIARYLENVVRGLGVGAGADPRTAITPILGRAVSAANPDSSELDDALRGLVPQLFVPAPDVEQHRALQEPGEVAPEEPVEVAPEEPVEVAPEEVVPEEPVAAAPEQPTETVSEEAPAEVEQATAEPIAATAAEPIAATAAEPIAATAAEPIAATAAEPIAATAAEPIAATAAEPIAATAAEPIAATAAETADVAALLDLSPAVSYPAESYPAEVEEEPAEPLGPRTFDSDLTELPQPEGLTGPLSPPVDVLSQPEVEVESAALWTTGADVLDLSPELRDGYPPEDVLTEPAAAEPVEVAEAPDEPTQQAPAEVEEQAPAEAAEQAADEPPVGVSPLLDLSPELSEAPVEAPDVEAPDVDAPDIEAPDVEAAAPEAAAPEASTNDIVDVAEFDAADELVAGPVGPPDGDEAEVPELLDLSPELRDLVETPPSETSVATEEPTEDDAATETFVVDEPTVPSDEDVFAPVEVSPPAAWRAPEERPFQSEQVDDLLDLSTVEFEDPWKYEPWADEPPVATGSEEATALVPQVVAGELVEGVSDDAAAEQDAVLAIEAEPGFDETDASGEVEELEGRGEVEELETAGGAGWISAELERKSPPEVEHAPPDDDSRSTEWRTVTSVEEPVAAPRNLPVRTPRRTTPDRSPQRVLRAGAMQGRTDSELPSGNNTTRRFLAGLLAVAAIILISVGVALVAHPSKHPPAAPPSSHVSTAPIAKTLPGTVGLGTWAGTGNQIIVPGAHTAVQGRQLAVSVECTGSGPVHVGPVTQTECSGDALTATIGAAAAARLQVSAPSGTSWRFSLLDEPATSTDAALVALPNAQLSTPASSRVGAGHGNGSASVSLSPPGGSGLTLENVRILLTCHGGGVTLSSDDNSVVDRYTHTCFSGWAYEFNVAGVRLPTTLHVTAGPATTWTVVAVPY